MSELNYSLKDLDSLMELGMRNSMFINKKSDLHNIALENKNNITNNGNPIYNSLYKNMKIQSLTDHINVAKQTKQKTDWQIDEFLSATYDIVVDDGQIDTTKSSYNKFNLPRLLSPYNSRSYLKLYQPYFKPTGRISDFAVANSIGAVGMKWTSRSNGSIGVLYSDRYNDKDMNNVIMVIDIGKNSNIHIHEHFENKDGLKIFKIIYLVRDYATLKLTRSQDLDEANKELGVNIIESNVIQHPGSKFEFEIKGEGSKYNQDLMYIDAYDNCKTKVEGRFDLFGNSINNNLVNIHHIGKGSKSEVDIRSVIDDSAHSSFMGSIIVDKDAVDTDAKLYNKNLLLSQTATAITEPQLDIHTKEISCNHGCTVSNIDKEQLYYLQSKGIETNMAEETLKQCFLT
tara:strand:- start:2505 stop:3704 length:1200 start_codon:yes stop_codon:yes gene_type:complete